MYSAYEIVELLEQIKATGSADIPSVEIESFLIDERHYVELAERESISGRPLYRLTKKGMEHIRLSRLRWSKQNQPSPAVLPRLNNTIQQQSPEAKVSFAELQQAIHHEFRNILGSKLGLGFRPIKVVPNLDTNITNIDNVRPTTAMHGSPFGTMIYLKSLNDKMQALLNKVSFGLTDRTISTSSASPSTNYSGVGKEFLQFGFMSDNQDLPDSNKKGLLLLSLMADYLKSINDKISELVGIEEDTAKKAEKSKRSASNRSKGADAAAEEERRESMFSRMKEMFAGVKDKMVMGAEKASEMALFLPMLTANLGKYAMAGLGAFSLVDALGLSDLLKSDFKNIFFLTAGLLAVKFGSPLFGAALIGMGAHGLKEQYSQFKESDWAEVLGINDFITSDKFKYHMLLAGLVALRYGKLPLAAGLIAGAGFQFERNESGELEIDWKSLITEDMLLYGGLAMLTKSPAVGALLLGMWAANKIGSNLLPTQSQRQQEIDDLRQQAETESNREERERLNREADRRQVLLNVERGFRENPVGFPVQHGDDVVKQNLGVIKDFWKFFTSTPDQQQMEQGKGAYGDYGPWYMPFRKDSLIGQWLGLDSKEPWDFNPLLDFMKFLVFPSKAEASTVHPHPLGPAGLMAPETRAAIASLPLTFAETTERDRMIDRIVMPQRIQEKTAKMISDTKTNDMKTLVREILTNRAAQHQINIGPSITSTNISRATVNKATITPNPRQNRTTFGGSFLGVP